MTLVVVNIQLTLDGKQRINEICTELASNGFEVVKVGDLTGIVSGYVDDSIVEYLKHIPGVKRLALARRNYAA